MEARIASGEVFADYLDWRAEHPSDDIMTDLLQAEFDDETGTRRRLTREEILTYMAVVVGAGNETTNRLIGWAGKVLADHPDQRRELAADPDLIPGAVDELLRYEPPGTHIARYVTRDVEWHGQKVPAGNAMLLLVASANRDDRRYPGGDRFDIHREFRLGLTLPLLGAGGGADSGLRGGRAGRMGHAGKQRRAKAGAAGTVWAEAGTGPGPIARQPLFGPN